MFKALYIFLKSCFFFKSSFKLGTLMPINLCVYSFLFTDISILEYVLWTNKALQLLLHITEIYTDV